MKTLKRGLIYTIILTVMFLYFYLCTLGIRDYYSLAAYFDYLLGVEETFFIGEDKFWVLAILGVLSATFLGWLMTKFISFDNGKLLCCVPSVVYFLPIFLYLSRGVVYGNIWCHFQGAISWLMPPKFMFRIYVLPDVYFYLLVLAGMVFYFSKRKIIKKGHGLSSEALWK